MADSRINAAARPAPAPAAAPARPAPVATAKPAPVAPRAPSADAFVTGRPVSATAAEQLTVFDEPMVRTGLSMLGLDSGKLRGLTDAAAVLPHLLAAARAMAAGDAQTALKNLGAAAGKVPAEWIETGIRAAAGRLPSTGAGGLARTMLTDREFVHQLVADEGMRQAYGQLFSGDLKQGLATAMKDESFRAAAGAALFRNSDARTTLARVGIRTPEDLEAVGGSVVDLYQAADALVHGKVGDGLRELGSAITGLPAEVRAKIITAAADALQLPPFIKDALIAANGILGNAEIAAEFGEVIDAFRNKDPRAAFENLAALGREIAENSPSAALAFMNALGHLPGSAGALFEDEELNEALCRSGSFEAFMGALEKLGRGDVKGAFGDVVKAGSKLLGDGKHIEVPGKIPFISGKELPFGVQGIENYGRLMVRFYDAMPAPVKKAIESQLVKVLAKNGLKSVPVIGSAVAIWDAGKEVKELVAELQKDKKDGFAIGINASQAIVELASVVPGLGAAMRPVATGLAVAETLNNLRDFDVGDLLGF